MAKTKRAMENEVKREMKKLGTYKKEYDKIIKIYAGMLWQYQMFEQQFEESDYKITEQYTNKAGATNERKVPLYTAMESLRKDIASYSDKLQLNPKANNSTGGSGKKQSKLADALSGMK
ncbi:P27 family phage terminase small subunit [Clostridium tyrobutyricum]|uniref:P27 family phage terminase small subunit n=1 Tax=Clostridium tyrobutyricum TaxID=1519 RepID=UPI001A9A9167|nr:P27 family phage terminase small subunit [Clostridium tyrobutyricum]